MFLYLEWLQNVLQFSHCNDWCFSIHFHFHIPPNPILKVVVLVALPLFPCLLCSIYSWRIWVCIHAFSYYYLIRFVVPIILTKRSNSLLAVHVLLTQQHAFRFYLHLPQIEEVTDAYFCRRMAVSVEDWMRSKVSINKWAPTLLFVTYNYCFSTIILKEATHMCQFF